MYSLVLKDYRSHFKSSLRYVWNNDFSPVFIMLLYCFYGIRMRDVYMAVAIPYAISLFLSRMYGGCMSKTFYLCPTDANYRREYVKVSIRLRIIISIAVYVIVNMILLAFGRISLLEFFMWLYPMVCTSIAFNTYTRPKLVKTRYNVERVYPFDGYYDLWNFLVQFTATITIVFLGGYELKVTDGEFIFACVMFGLLTIWTVVMVRKFYGQVVEQACFYAE